MKRIKIGEVKIDYLYKKHKKPSLMRELVKEKLTGDVSTGLYYRGIPVILRQDVPSGFLYFMNEDPDTLDEDMVWTMRCLANDIEGKRTWLWDKLVWKIKRCIKM